MNRGNRERRTKFSNDYRRQRYDSDESEHSSGEYTDSAQPLEKDNFPIPTRRMLDNFQALDERTIENTHKVDLDALEELGLKEDFLSLTGRVGFTEEFWAIEADTYTKCTKEFLSSLELKEDA